MPKDYAKRVLMTARQSTKRRRRYEFFIIPILLIAIVGVYIGFNYKNHIAKEGWIAHFKQLMHPHHPVKHLAKKSNQNSLQDEAPIHFDFYDQLPNQRVPEPMSPDELANKPQQSPSEKMQTSPQLSAQAAMTKAVIKSKVKSLAAAHSDKQNNPSMIGPDSSIPSKEGRYILSFGQFHNLTEASQLRISLMLADCDAEVIEFYSAHGKIYRVQLGPFRGQATPKKLQAQLFQKGVSSKLQKV